MRLGIIWCRTTAEEAAESMLRFRIETVAIKALQDAGSKGLDQHELTFLSGMNDLTEQKRYGMRRAWIVRGLVTTKNNRWYCSTEPQSIHQLKTNMAIMKERIAFQNHHHDMIKHEDCIVSILKRYPDGVSPSNILLELSVQFSGSSLDIVYRTLNRLKLRGIVRKGIGLRWILV